MKTQILDPPLFCLRIPWLQTDHVKIVSTEAMKAGLWDAASLPFVCFWLLMQMLDDTGPEKVSNNKMGHLNKMIYSLFWQICIKLALPQRRMCTKRSLYASFGPLWAFDFVSGNGEYAIKQRFQNTFKVLLKLK